MGSGECLFVYGTLMRPVRHPMSRVLRRYASFLEEATMEGKLYDLGAYPALREGKGQIRGELWRVANAAPLFRILDRYEGAEYLRVKQRAEGVGGGEYDAWVYLYTLPLRGAKPILCGDYALFKGVRRI